MPKVLYLWLLSHSLGVSIMAFDIFPHFISLRDISNEDRVLKLILEHEWGILSVINKLLLVQYLTTFEYLFYCYKIHYHTIRLTFEIL
jgi:hypothetical protein